MSANVKVTRKTETEQEVGLNISRKRSVNSQNQKISFNRTPSYSASLLNNARQQISGSQLVSFVNGRDTGVQKDLMRNTYQINIGGGKQVSFQINDPIFSLQRPNERFL